MIEDKQPLDYILSINDRSNIAGLWRKFAEFDLKHREEIFLILALYLTTIKKEAIDTPRDESIQYKTVQQWMDDFITNKRLNLNSLFIELEDWIDSHHTSIDDYLNFYSELMKFKFVQANDDEFFRINEEILEDHPEEDTLKHVYNYLKSKLLKFEQPLENLAEAKNNKNDSLIDISKHITSIAHDLNILEDLTIIFNYGLANKLIAIEEIKDNIVDIHQLSRTIVSKLDENEYLQYLLQDNVIDFIKQSDDNFAKEANQELKNTIQKVYKKYIKGLKETFDKKENETISYKSLCQYLYFLIATEI